MQRFQDRADPACGGVDGGPSRLRPEDGAFHPDEFDVGQSDEAQQVVQISGLEIEGGPFAFGEDAACGGNPDTPGAKAANDRHEKFEQIGKAFKTTGDQLKSDAPDIAVIKTNAALQVSLSELQKGYDQLQEELDTALASLKTLEAQRTAHHQDTARRLEEIDRLTSSAQSQEEELSSLQHELETRRKVQVSNVCFTGAT